MTNYQQAPFPQPEVAGLTAGFAVAAVAADDDTHMAIAHRNYTAAAQAAVAADNPAQSAATVR